MAVPLALRFLAWMGMGQFEVMLLEIGPGGWMILPLLSLIGYGMNYALLRIEQRYVPWASL